jgi:hypothetical protein
MTVCIAAICSGAKRIVAVSDQQVSTFDFSADNQATKISIICKNWWLMWSADDVLKIPPLIESIKNYLWGDNRTVEEVSRALSSAYQKQIKQEAENRYLARFGMTMESFLAEGKNQLTEESFESFRDRIEQIKLGCEIMAYGFDPKGAPHILVLKDPGTVDFCGPNTSSFKAIGTGGYRAESTLYFHKVSWTMHETLAVYHVCEAKFMAESALGVGKSTVGMILQSEGGLVFLNSKAIDKIRSLWEKKGKPKVHKSTSKIVSGIINTALDETRATMREAKAKMAEESNGSSSPSPT